MYSAPPPLPRCFAGRYNAILAYRQQITQTRFPTMITPPLGRPPLFGYRQVLSDPNVQFPQIIFPRNVSFREYYVFVSNAAATAASQFCQRDNFEGFKLRSSNLTHALLIQISRTSSIIDIVVPSKMAAGGHFVKKFQKKN